jgi:hypothetical protein
MQEYFKTLNTDDPLFHMLVRIRIKQLEDHTKLSRLTIDNLSDADELAILRQYCTMLHKEYQALKTFLLKNAQLTLQNPAMEASSGGMSAS